MPIERNRLQAYSKLEFLAKQVVEGFITGLHKSPFHGFSVEFAEHRLYNAGESTRHIDWKLYAKTDKMFVKRYEEETNLRCYLVIDHSTSMHFPFIEKADIENPNKMTFAVYAAAALIELMKKQRDAYALSLFSNELDLHTQARSNPSHQQFLYSHLEKLLEEVSLDQPKQTCATEALHVIAENTHKRSLIILFSDMFDNSDKKEELFSALQHLKHNKHEVILFHVVDQKKEIDFDYENRPYRFIDSESGEELKLNPKDVKEPYKKIVSDYTKELKLRCAQYKIDFVEADINLGFDQILMTYLLKRAKMR